MLYLGGHHSFTGGGGLLESHTLLLAKDFFQFLKKKIQCIKLDPKLGWVLISGAEETSEARFHK